MRLRLEELCWDDVAITHDLSADMSALLNDWFDHWYDPHDSRFANDSQPNDGFIHCLGILPGVVQIDFGAASTEAFWELITTLREAGATDVVIRDTRSHSNGD